MNLEKLNLVELNAQEIQETEGGEWIIAIVGMVGATLAWAYAEGKEMGHAIGSRL
jgi:hypothetical protein